MDRFSNWPDLREATAHTPDAGTAGLIKAYRELFATFGVPEHLSSDGDPAYTSHAFKAFMKTWGIKHRLSSAYHPQSNGRAEVAVKGMKRLLRDNIRSNGELDTDAVTRGILQLRNTPETDSGLSPAQVLLGRTLRDTLPLRPPFPHRTTVFDPNSAVSRVWKDVWSAKEQALKTRLARQVDKLEVGSHTLKPLEIGDTVRIQNQTGNHPTKWDKTGTVMQIGDNDQYIVMVDGSRRLTLRNRRYLRKMIRPIQPVKPLQTESLPSYIPASPATRSPIMQPNKSQAPVEQSLRASPPVSNIPSAGSSSPPPNTDLRVSLPSPPMLDAEPASPLPTLNNQVALPGRMSPNSGPACQPGIGVLPDTSQNPVNNTPASTPVLRRSTRECKQRMLYDPTTGGSIPSKAVSDAL